MGGRIEIASNQYVMLDDKVCEKFLDYFFKQVKTQSAIVHVGARAFMDTESNITFKYVNKFYKELSNRVVDNQVVYVFTSMDKEKISKRSLLKIENKRITELNVDGSPYYFLLWMTSKSKNCKIYSTIDQTMLASEFLAANGKIKQLCPVSTKYWELYTKQNKQTYKSIHDKKIFPIDAVKKYLNNLQKTNK